MNVLLDTNVLIAHFTGDEDLRIKVRKSSIFFSVIVLAELQYGAKTSRRITENLERLNELLQDAIPLPIDLATASFFSDIKSSLRTKGRPIPDHDIWIAATAFQHGLTLISRDAHFREIDNLKVDKW
ncbi:MAG: type II toxin-antitoxin system VapC family toxin [Phycisphaerae bacterium]|nr:type II toxin-antitoxin system VapC family toxin [Phycisphaerae bacterium]